MTDPELHRRREILRQRYNFNKSRLTKGLTTCECRVEGVKSVGEILQEHPLIQKLINNEVRDNSAD